MVTQFSRFTGDPVGKFLALVTLTPYAIASGFLTLILFRRDLHTVRLSTVVDVIVSLFADFLQITFLVGVLCSEVLNFFLKNAICEDRPITRPYNIGYGMPSSHAQFVWFFATYVIYFVFIR